MSIDIKAIERSLRELIFKKGTLLEARHLKLRERGDTKVKWELDTRAGPYFVRAELIPPHIDFWTFLHQRGGAQAKNVLHNPKAKHVLGQVAYPITSITLSTIQKKIHGYELVELPTPEDGAVYLEFQRKIKVEKSYEDFLNALGCKRKLAKADEERLREICLLLKGIHKPTDIRDAGPLYEGMLKEILKDMHDYIPAQEEHPTLSQDEINLGTSLCWKLIRAHANKSFRLVFLHGDVWRKNIVFIRNNAEELHPELVDYHYRHNLGDAGFDCGRFMMDFVRYRLIMDKKIYEEAGNLFLDTYAEVVGDRHIHEMLWVGMFSRLWIAVKTADPRGFHYARRLYEGMIRILLDDGVFNWRAFRG